MTKRAVSEWGRYAILAYVVRRLGNEQQLGRKAFQKVVYLLQKLAGVPLGFRYTFYTYGVYSFELASTLGAVENMKGIIADYDPAVRAHNLRAGKEAETLEHKGRNLLEDYASEIESILDFARGKTGKELELSSTVIYVARNEELEEADAEKRLIERVAELKPRFSRSQITDDVGALRSRGFLPAK